MDQKKIAAFISERRKQMNYTQRGLAEKLGISDKAVSKWERGLSCPDISLLSELSSLLGITVNELLNGECSEQPNPEINDSIQTALQYMDTAKKKEIKNLRAWIFLIFTGVLFLGAAVCIICDLAVSQSFTWSLYPITAIVFSWLVTVPVLLFPKKGDLLSLSVLSLLILPFFWVLHIILGKIPLFLEISVPVSLLSLCLLWLAYLLFHKCRSKLTAGAASALAAIPFAFIINLLLSGLLGEPVIDIWDFITYMLLLATAVGLFYLNSIKKKKLSD